MAQDRGSEEANTSHELDPDTELVTLYKSLGVDAEMEADIIHGILESSGISSMVIGSAEFPNLGYEVRVAQADLETSQQLVEEAKASGPEAAAEAEAASEES